MDYKKYIASVKDFPIKGVLFRDITPLMADKDAFYASCKELSDYGRKVKADIVVGPESRGFIFGCPIAFDLNIGFIPIRKPNKLPRENISLSYDLEYGHNTLCIHSDSIKKGQRVLIVDDLLATGGTIKATIELVEKLGGVVVGLGFLIELSELKGRDLLTGYNIKSLITY